MARLRAALAAIPSDYGSARLALLVVASFYVGARRLEHLQYLVGDPLVARFCGLARLPTARTVSNWLKQFTQRCWSWLPLKQLAAERREWIPLAPGVTGFEHRLTVHFDREISPQPSASKSPAQAFPRDTPSAC